jgi:hypothetical protein
VPNRWREVRAPSGFPRQCSERSAYVLSRQEEAQEDPQAQVRQDAEEDPLATHAQEVGDLPIFSVTSFRDAVGYAIHLIRTTIDEQCSGQRKELHGLSA